MEEGAKEHAYSLRDRVELRDGRTGTIMEITLFRRTDEVGYGIREPNVTKAKSKVFYAAEGEIKGKIGQAA